MIYIVKNSNGDTRTANDHVTFKQFQAANDMHRKDVREVMDFMSHKMQDAGMNHDITKKTQEKMFYNDFIETLNTGKNFENSEWANMHWKAERHHLNRCVPDDVNLIDVIEMIADCVCAGKARSGEIRPIKIDFGILNKAFMNTVELIDDNSKVIELLDQDTNKYGR